MTLEKFALYMGLTALAFIIGLITGIVTERREAERFRWPKH